MFSLDKLGTISRIWKREYTGDNKPEVYMCYHIDKWYLTVDDSKSIFLFLGQNNKIYAATKSNCKIQQDKKGRNFYFIKKLYGLQVISCKINSYDNEEFISENILNKK